MTNGDRSAHDRSRRWFERVRCGYNTRMARTLGQMQEPGFGNDAGVIDRDGAAAWIATLRLAAFLSVIAVLVVAALAAVVEVPTTAVVLTVIVIGFAASWVHSGRSLS